MLRAIPAQWFELLVPRPMVARAVETLAGTGLVELDPGGDQGSPLDFGDLREKLGALREMRRRFGGHWPAPDCRCAERDRMLETEVERVLSVLKRWQKKAVPLIRRLETLDRDAAELERLVDLLDHLRGEDIDFGELVAERPELRAAVFALEADSETPRAARSILYRRVDTPRHAYLLTLGRPDAIRELADVLGGRRGRVLALPSWLEGGPEKSLELAEARLASLRSDHDRAAHDLVSLNESLDLARVLGDLLRAEWMVEHLEGINVGGYFAQVTGWTSDTRDGETLRGALTKAEIPAVLHLTEEPADKIPPTLTRNPFWARPFEIFARLLGTPGRGEAEPSALVAIIAPLLFGYMFGDVGQGLVLIAAGIWLRRFGPEFGMLISGGVFSVVFGFVFGSVFTLESLIHPLWTNPMENPIPVMVAPLFGGAVLILTGMLLNGLEHHWQQRTLEWLADEAGLVVFYAAAVASVFQPWMLVVAVLGLLWQGVGGAWTHRRHRGAALARGIATLPERLMQLAVNSLSFVRVGAFALAHSGLGQATTSLAEAADSAVVAGLVLIAGNILILVIEGIVVAVQTTRLVLFEFFIRFLRTAGRPFQPLTPPAPS